MPVKIDKIIEELDFLSDRISSQVRTIAMAMIALVWVLMVGGKDNPIKLEGYARTQVFISGLIALGAMALDFLQYFFGYLVTRDVLKCMENSHNEEGEFNAKDWRYRLREIAFWSKQTLLLIALGWLGAVLGLYLIF